MRLPPLVTIVITAAATLPASWECGVNSVTAQGTGVHDIQGSRAEDSGLRERDNSTTLEVHSVHAASFSAIADWVTSVTSRERVAFLPRSGQIAVFASDSVHQAVAAKIDASQPRQSPSDQAGAIVEIPEFDPKSTVALAQPPIENAPSIPAPTASHNTTPRGPSGPRGAPQSTMKMLPLPRSPVRVIHVKGLDLLVIRGRGPVRNDSPTPPDAPTAQESTR